MRSRDEELRLSLRCVELTNKGDDPNQIAKRLGLSRDSVIRRLRKQGVTPVSTPYTISPRDVKAIHTKRGARKPVDFDDIPEAERVSSILAKHTRTNRKTLRAAHTRFMENATGKKRKKINDPKAYLKAIHKRFKSERHWVRARLNEKGIIKDE